MKNAQSKPLVVIQCYEDRQPTLPLRKAEDVPNDFPSNGHVNTKRESSDNPPPPPPMPTVKGLQNGHATNGDDNKLTPNKINPDLINNSNNNLRKNGALMRTPTPDYNNVNNAKIESVAHIKLKNVNGEKAELDSLESFKLRNPSNVQPKPPTNYFVKAPNGTATMKKLGRPVSVTIGEYASGGGGGARREPSKLDFLNGDKPDGPHAPVDDSISNRLQSELALTLSRSNLRKKTEALVDTGR